MSQAKSYVFHLTVTLKLQQSKICINWNHVCLISGSFECQLKQSSDYEARRSGGFHISFDHLGCTQCTVHEHFLHSTLIRMRSPRLGLNLEIMCALKAYNYKKCWQQLNSCFIVLLQHSILHINNMTEVSVTEMAYGFTGKPLVNKRATVKH